MNEAPPRTITAASLLGLLAVACGPPAPPPLGLDEHQVIERFLSLHRNIYTVYSLAPDRDTVWDLLAESFTGPALTQQYVEHYTTLVLSEREETGIKVLTVDYDTVELLPSPPGTARVEAEWAVGGVVTHRGHKHPRVNRYHAVYHLVPGPTGVRIADTKLKNMQRVQRVLVEGGGWTLDRDDRSAGGLMSPSMLLEGGIELGDTGLDDPTAEVAP
jgi:hypothetical protein